MGVMETPRPQSWPPATLMWLLLEDTRLPAKPRACHCWSPRGFSQTPHWSPLRIWRRIQTCKCCSTGRAVRLPDHSLAPAPTSDLTDLPVSTAALSPRLTSHSHPRVEDALTTCAAERVDSSCGSGTPHLDPVV